MHAIDTSDKTGHCIVNSFREKVVEVLEYAGLLPDKYREAATIYLSQLLQILQLGSDSKDHQHHATGDDTNKTTTHAFTEVRDHNTTQDGLTDSFSAVKISSRSTVTNDDNISLYKNLKKPQTYKYEGVRETALFNQDEQETHVLDKKETEDSDAAKEDIKDDDVHSSEETDHVLMAELDTFKPESNIPYVKEGTPDASADDVSDVSSLLSFLPQLSPYIKLDIKDGLGYGGCEREAQGFIHMTVERADGSVQNLKLGGVTAASEKELQQYDHQKKHVAKNHGDKQMTLIQEQLSRVEKENEPFPETPRAEKQVEKKGRGRPRKIQACGGTELDSGQKSFTCETCNTTVQSHHALIVHKRGHTGEKPYACSYCSKSFTTKGNMKQHEATHKDDKPWTCSYCGKSFKEKKILKVHLRRHTGERPYSCHLCGKGFSQSGVLKEHLLIHSGLKPHLCDLCGQEFRGSSSLRAHKLRHLNQRDFKCEQCDKEFICKNDLTRHQLSHSGAKPFHCAMCPKQFTRQTYLKEHLNIHTGDKPFACSLCSAAFTDSMSLHRHRKKHLKEKEDSIKRSYQSELEKELMSGTQRGNQSGNQSGNQPPTADDNLPKIEIRQQTGLGEQTSVQVVLDENTTAEEFQHFHSLVLSAANSAEFTLNTSNPAKQIYQVMCVDPDTQELVTGHTGQPKQALQPGQNLADFSAMDLLANATAQQYNMQ